MRQLHVHVHPHTYVPAPPLPAAAAAVAAPTVTNPTVVMEHAHLASDTAFAKATARSLMV